MTKATNLSSLRSLRLRLTQAKQAVRPDSLGEHVTVTGKERNKKRTMEQRVRTMLNNGTIEQWENTKSVFSIKMIQNPPTQVGVPSIFLLV